MPKDKVLVTPAPALVLFDIDGTLIRRAGPHHREALVDAVRQVTGLETTTDHIPVHGMLDPDILSRMLRDAGASPAQIRRAIAVHPGISTREESEAHEPDLLLEDLSALRMEMLLAPSRSR